MHFHKWYHEKKKKIDVNAREITEYLETTNIKYLNLLHQKEKAFFYLYRLGKEEVNNMLQSNQNKGTRFI